jgi:hypothetical protein
MDGACSIHKKDKKYVIMVRKPERKRHLGRQGLYGRKLLEWILRKYGGKMWTRCMWFRIGTMNMVMKLWVP